MRPCPESGQLLGWRRVGPGSTEEHHERGDHLEVMEAIGL
jgi:hypothetical protein